MPCIIQKWRRQNQKSFETKASKNGILLSHSTSKVNWMQEQIELTRDIKWERLSFYQREKKVSST